MSLEDNFKVPEHIRSKIIDRYIIPEINIDNKDDTRKRIFSVLESYSGCDSNVLSILTCAAENKRFEEFIKKLENYYEEHLRNVSPNASKTYKIPEVVKTENFFLECYKSLGVKPKILINS
jgi:hypothetical protein